MSNNILDMVIDLVEKEKLFSRYGYGKKIHFLITRTNKFEFLLKV